MKKLFFLILILAPVLLIGQYSLYEIISKKATEIEQEVIDLRRHYHQYPELSNREFKTAEHIAKQLEKLGLQVETGIAITGVVGYIDSKITK